MIPPGRPRGLWRPNTQHPIYMSPAWLFDVFSGSVFPGLGLFCLSVLFSLLHLSIPPQFSLHGIALHGLVWAVSRLVGWSVCWLRVG